jgi:hypothetical protein
MAELKLTTRCAGCPGEVVWLLSDRGRNGAPEVAPEGDCMTRDGGREVFCEACTKAALEHLEQRRAAAKTPAPGPVPKKPNGAGKEVKEQAKV